MRTEAPVDSRCLTYSCLCGFEAFVWHVGFISELWHQNQDSDLGPNSASGVPQGTTTAVSSVFEQYLCTNYCWNLSSEDIFMTFSKNRGNSVMHGLKATTGSGLSWSGLQGSVPSAWAIFWPRLDVHGLSELQAVSPALVVVLQAWHRLNNTRLEVSQSEV